MSFQKLFVPLGGDKRQFIEVNGRPYPKGDVFPIPDENYEYLSLNDQHGRPIMDNTRFNEILYTNGNDAEVYFQSKEELEAYVLDNFFKTADDGGGTPGASDLQATLTAGDTATGKDVVLNLPDGKKGAQLSGGYVYGTLQLKDPNEVLAPGHPSMQIDPIAIYISRDIPDGGDVVSARTKYGFAEDELPDDDNRELTFATREYSTLQNIVNAGHSITGDNARIDMTTVVPDPLNGDYEQRTILKPSEITLQTTSTAAPKIVALNTNGVKVQGSNNYLWPNLSDGRDRTWIATEGAVASYLPYWTDEATIGYTDMTYNGLNYGLGTAADSAAKLTVNGGIKSTTGANSFAGATAITNVLSVSQVNQGTNNTLGGNNASVFGADNTSTGTRAFVTGRQNVGSLGENFVAGLQNTCSGVRAVATGQMNTASNTMSHAFGWSCTSSGVAAVALSMGTVARSYGETSAGVFNTDYTPASTTAINGLDRAFSVGIGADTSNRKDGLNVMKSGQVLVPAGDVDISLSGKGVILVDTVTGTRYRVTVVSGVLALTAV